MRSSFFYCIASGKAAEFGQLKNGYMFETSTGLARTWVIIFVLYSILKIFHKGNIKSLPGMLCNLYVWVYTICQGWLYEWHNGCYCYCQITIDYGRLLQKWLTQQKNINHSMHACRITIVLCLRFFMPNHKL